MNFFRKRLTRILAGLPTLLCMLLAQGGWLSLLLTSGEAQALSPQELLERTSNIDTSSVQSNAFSIGQRYEEENPTAAAEADALRTGDHATIIEAGTNSAQAAEQSASPDLINHRVLKMLKKTATSDQRTHYSMADHPIMQGFDAVFDAEGEIIDRLKGECETLASVKIKKDEKWLPDERVCQRPAGMTETCDLYHKLSAEEAGAGFPGYDGVSKKVQLRVSLTLNNHDQKMVYVHNNKTEWMVVDQGLTLDYQGECHPDFGCIYWDTVSGKLVIDITHNSLTGLQFTWKETGSYFHDNFTIETANDFANNIHFVTGGTAETNVKRSMSSSIGVDINPWIQSFQNSNDYVWMIWGYSPTGSQLETLKSRTIQMTISMKAPSLSITEDYWYPQSCVDKINEWKSSGCTGGEQTVIQWVKDPDTQRLVPQEVTVDLGVPFEMISGPDAYGCVVVSGVQLCHNPEIDALIGEPPFSELDKLGLHYKFTKPRCAEQLMANTCEPFQGVCDVVSTKTTSWDAAGDPLTVEEVYDCGKVTSFEWEEKHSSLVCNGELFCIDGECTTPVEDQAGSMVEVAGMYSAVQMMRNQEWSCADPNDIETCTIFNGKPGECRKTINGNDCCESPVSTSAVDYVRGIMALNELRQVEAVRAGFQAMTEALPGASADVINGSWSAIETGIDNAIDFPGSAIDAIKEVLNPSDVAEKTATSTVNSASANVASESAAQATDEGLFAMIDTLKQKMMGWARDAIAETAGDATAKAFIEQNAETGEFVSGPVIQTFNVVMAIYTIVDIWATSYYACEESEAVLAMSIAQKRTHYVDSYCSSDILGACDERSYTHCEYDTPLARIVVEQANDQLGRGFGTAKAPECGGISIRDLTSLDWDKINLDEWIAMLMESGVMPDLTTDLKERLTGNLRMLAPESGRPDAIERLEAKHGGGTKEVNSDTVRESMREEFWGH